MNRNLICLFLLTNFLSFSLLSAQNTTLNDSLLRTARGYVVDLAGEEFAGRGYQLDGHKKAADYIATQFELFGLKGIPAPEDKEKPYHHPFTFSLNVIDSAAVFVNGERLKIGEDYIVYKSSGGHEVIGKAKSVGFGLPNEYLKFSEDVAVIETGLPDKVLKNEELKERYTPFSGDNEKIIVAKKLGAKGLVILHKKLTAGFSSIPVDIPVIVARKSSWPRKVKRIQITTIRKFRNVHSQNVIGYIPGSQYPDSFILVSAHYDHLGKMGEAVFWGANDNASGTAMMMSMAEHFSKPENKSPYSMVFIAFGAEEAGLIGSRHYVEINPAFPLANTKFILNLDLMGNGDKAITAVAGLDFEQKFKLLKTINDSLQATPKVKGRKNAPNSDHYFFVKNGVEGFFVYTEGGPPHYHDIYDTPEALLFSRYCEVRELLITFLIGIQK